MQRLLGMSPQERDVFFMEIGLPQLIGSQRCFLPLFFKQSVLLLEKEGSLFAVVMARSMNDRTFYRRSFALLNQLLDLHDQKDMQVFCLSYQLNFYPAIKGPGLWNCLKIKRTL